MDDKARRRMHLECLYDMFRDRIEENVIYIVYTENEGKIQSTIDQLMCIAACSLTGYDFEPTTNKEGSTVYNTVQPSSTSSASSRLPPNNSLASPASSGLGSRYQTTNVCQSKQNSRHQTSSVDSNGTSSTKSDYDDSERGDDEDENASSEHLDIDSRIEKVQNSIEQLLNEKASCHDKASQYLNKKMYQVTSYYSDLSGHCRRQIETHTRKLIDLLLEKSENANTIDLHGLNPIQAKLVVSELLNIRQDQLSIDKQGETNIDIITGWGKHTVKTGQHRIRPTILALLREKGFQYQHLNKGALRVTIRR